MCGGWKRVVDAAGGEKESEERAQAAEWVCGGTKNHHCLRPAKASKHTRTQQASKQSLGFPRLELSVSQQSARVHMTNQQTLVLSA